MSKLTTNLYKTSRKLNKTASKLNDLENLVTGKPEKVVKKHMRKNVYKKTNKIARFIINLFK